MDKASPAPADPLIITEFTRVVGGLPLLDPLIHALEAQLAVDLGPQRFRGAPLAGKVHAPNGKTRDAGVAEATNVVGMLFVVDEVKRLLRGEASGACVPTEEGRRRAAAEIEKWHSRPANWHFLVAALHLKKSRRACVGPSSDACARRNTPYAEATWACSNVMVETVAA